MAGNQDDAYRAARQALETVKRGGDPKEIERARARVEDAWNQVCVSYDRAGQSRPAKLH